MTKPIRAVLVDDEPLAVQGLKMRLSDFDDIDIVGTAANGREAIKLIRAEKPDLAFLDIQMPGLDGFDVVRGLVDGPMPIIVFVTAFDQYAMDAFKAKALDYLLKPVDEDRLQEAIGRIRETVRQRTAVEQTAKIIELIEGREDPPVAAITAILDHAPEASADQWEKVFSIKDRGKIFRVTVDSIEYIDAAGDYMCIHTGSETHILRETMKTMERRLDPKRFQRVHRSTIVNLDKVKEVTPHTNGECFLALESGAELKVSRSYKDVVIRFT